MNNERELREALSHPLRRRILRILHAAGSARSPRELSRTLEVPPGNVSYHVGVLCDKGAVALSDRLPRGGSTENFYLSLLAENTQTAQLLEATEREDRGMEPSR